MTFESDLFNVLKAATPRIFPDFAPVDTPRPYVTYQAIGGQVINPLSNTAPGKRNAEMQISVWSNNRSEALTLSRSIENAMRAATAFTAQPLSAPASDYDPDVPVYGCRQDFSVWFTS